MHDDSRPEHSRPDHSPPERGGPDERGPHEGGHERGAYEAFRDGDHLLTTGNPHAAVVALERARELEPDKASVRETLARAYYRTGRYDSAAVEFGITVDLDPVNDYAHFGLGLALARTGDLVGARRHLRIAVVMRPDNDDYAQALADLADLAGPDDAGAP
jgi:Flp pilus assembly protein TadD